MEVGTIEIKPKREEHALALARITADWPVNDVLSRFPATGPIFLQQGSMMRAVTGQIYPDYPPLTVAEYAVLNGVEVGRLLKALNAEAEGQEVTEAGSRSVRSGEERIDRIGRGSSEVGYTGAYREPGNVDSQHLVTSLLERGPE
jgi:hypothetical protein